jgi:hypothetical protein
MPKLTAFMIIGNRKRGEPAEGCPVAAEHAAPVSWGQGSWGQVRRDREVSAGPFRVR